MTASLSWETCEVLASEFGMERFKRDFPEDAAVYQKVMDQLEMNGGKEFCEQEFGITGKSIFYKG